MRALPDVPPELLDLARIRAERRRRERERRIDRYLETATEPQRRFHEQAQEGRLFVGGNRSGKTTAGALESLWWLSGRHPFLRTPAPPVYGRCVSPGLPGGEDQEHVARDKVREWVRDADLRGGSWDRAYSILGRTLHFANGSWIQFLSSDQEIDKHAGSGLHFVWLDEECPRAIWLENLQRLSEGTVPGKWWLTMTPVRGLAWIEEEIYGRPDLYGITEADVETNRKNLPPGFIESRERQLAPADKQVRLRGKWGTYQGRVYDLYGEAHRRRFEVVIE